jgi:hypothetical protein
VKASTHRSGGLAQTLLEPDLLPVAVLVEVQTGQKPALLSRGEAGREEPRLVVGPQCLGALPEVSSVHLSLRGVVAEIVISGNGQEFVIERAPAVLESFEAVGISGRCRLPALVPLRIGEVP